MKLEIIKSLPVERSHHSPLLFVHGAYHGAWCWNEHFLPYFSSQGYPCYALSLRGHGESAGKEELSSFSLDDYVDDVFLAMSQIEGKPVVIGHSVGGAVVQKMLHVQPESIKAAVLMAPIPPNGMVKDTLRLLFTNFRAMVQVSSFNQGRNTAFPAGLFFSSQLTAEEKSAFTSRLQPEIGKATYELYRRIVPKMMSINVPLLVLGSKNDVLFSEKTVRSVGKAYQTEPIIFPDVAHVMMLDPNWQDVADQILIFLREAVAAKQEGAV